MAGFVERRKYQRCDTTICKALMSADGLRWENFQINDISAGGLSFTSNKFFNENQRLYFDLYVYNMLSEFNMKLEGCIIRQEKRKDKYCYAVRFDNINKYVQVQLDELIKSKITVTSNERPAYEDGVYTFILLPRTRKRILGGHFLKR